MPAVKSHENVVRLERKTSSIGSVATALLVQSAVTNPQQTLGLCSRIEDKLGKPEGRGAFCLPNNKGRLLFGPHHVMGMIHITTSVMLTEQGLVLDEKAPIIDIAPYLGKAEIGTKVGDVITTGIADLDAIELLKSDDEPPANKTHILATIPVKQIDRRWIDVRLSIERAAQTSGEPRP